jgi:acetylornithine deacetylase
VLVNLHASLITGGTEESAIPDHCKFTVERRTLPEETLERVEVDIADLLDRCRPADPRLNVTTRNGSAAPAPAPPTVLTQLAQDICS